MKENTLLKSLAPVLLLFVSCLFVLVFVQNCRLSNIVAEQQNLIEKQEKVLKAFELEAFINAKKTLEYADSI